MRSVAPLYGDMAVVLGAHSCYATEARVCRQNSPTLPQETPGTTQTLQAKSATVHDEGVGVLPALRQLLSQAGQLWQMPAGCGTWPLEIYHGAGGQGRFQQHLAAMRNQALALPPLAPQAPLLFMASLV